MQLLKYFAEINEVVGELSSKLVCSCCSKKGALIIFVLLGIV